MNKHSAPGRKTADTAPSGNVPPSPRQRRLPLTASGIFFLCTWIWAGYYLGDAFRYARETTPFSTDPAWLLSLWEQPYGSLWIIGRALLQAFRLPILGGALLALMLTLISWLNGYVLRLPAHWRAFEYLPAAAYLFFVAAQGFNLSSMHETGMLMGIPFCALFILVFQSVFIRSFSKKPMPTLFCPRAEEESPGALAMIVALLLPACASILSLF